MAFSETVEAIFYYWAYSEMYNIYVSLLYVYTCKFISSISQYIHTASANTYNHIVNNFMFSDVKAYTERYKTKSTNAPNTRNNGEWRHAIKLLNPSKKTKDTFEAEMALCNQSVAQCEQLSKGSQCGNLSASDMELII